VGRGFSRDIGITAKLGFSPCLTAGTKRPNRQGLKPNLAGRLVVAADAATHKTFSSKLRGAYARTAYASSVRNS
jgi:hypothetical protein